MGYAAALALLVLVVLLLVTIAQVGLARFWVHEEVGS
jgi:ABC-type sugar transport system permease subunit